MPIAQRDTAYTRYKEIRIGNVRAESGCEYILPDYKGQIKKLLNFTAKPIGAGKYETDDGCSSSGIVEYKILYYDASGELTSAEFTSDYDFEVKAGAPISDSCVTTKVASSSVRVIGPRKVSVKCTLDSDVFMKTEDGIPNLPDADDYECRCATVMAHRAEYCTGAEREYAEEGELIEGFGCDDVEIVAEDAKVRVNEVNVRDGSIEANGEIIINAIVRINSAECVMNVCKIPFEETIPREAVTAPILHASCIGSITSLSVGVNDKTDADGDHIGSAPVFSVTMELSARLDYADSVDLICDVYSSSGECCAQTVEYDYSEPIACGIKRERVIFDISSADSSCLPKTVLNVSSALKNLSYELGEKYIKMTGECESNVITASDGDEPYTVIKGAAPFEVNIPLGKSTDTFEAQIIANVGIGDSNALITETGVKVEAVIDCDLLLLDRKSIRAVSSAVVTPRMNERNDSCVKVYYPDDSESLWDICKHFGSSVEAVICENSINPDALNDPWNLKWMENRNFILISEL